MRWRYFIKEKEVVAFYNILAKIVVTQNDLANWSVPFKYLLKYLPVLEQNKQSFKII